MEVVNRATRGSVDSRYAMKSCLIINTRRARPLAGIFRFLFSAFLVLFLAVSVEAAPIGRNTPSGNSVVLSEDVGGLLLMINLQARPLVQCPESEARGRGHSFIFRDAIC
jgi:hypothetical protein